MSGDEPRPHAIKRCATCMRFRAYQTNDRFCLVCGNASLEEACSCDRSFDYALEEEGSLSLHCPRCGRSLRGRASEFE